MKKILFFIMFIMLMASFTVVASAEGDVPDGNIADNVLDRVIEWWEDNKAEILASVSGVGAIVYGAVMWLKSKKPLLALLGTAKTTDERENALIKGYNEMVGVVDAQCKIIEALGQKVAELQVQITNTENIEAHIAKVLSTVYTNSLLPQGVKNMVNVECAQCMTIANKDLGVEVVCYDETDEGNVD